MSRFAVTPEQLLSASSSIEPTSGGGATLPPASMAGAAASTPVAAAWAAFLDDAVAASAGLDEVSAGLAAGLRAAGTNYERTEVQATDGYAGGHR